MQISDAMRDAINRHINAEFYSSYLYLSMSAFCDAADLPGFAHWMRLQSGEEYQHAIRLIDYVQDRGGKVALLPIEQPPLEFDSVEQIMADTLAHERHVSDLIGDLYRRAVDDNDLPTQVMLQWFVNEQVEEEKSVQDVIAALRMVNGQPDALLLLDREMGARTAIPAA